MSPIVEAADFPVFFRGKLCHAPAEMLPAKGKRRMRTDAPRQPAPKHGPGSELKAVAKELGSGGLGCGCNAVAARMNHWGADGCWRNIDQLRPHLSEVLALARAKNAVWLDPQEPAESLIQYVMWRAERGSNNNWGEPVTIPEPPPLDLSPRHKRAVVTIRGNDHGRAMLAIAEPLMRAYAERVGADFVAVDWPGIPSWPMSMKYGAWSAAAHYERIAYFDGDVILRPGCVNVFDCCEPDEIGIVSELARHRNNPQYRIERDFRSLRELAGFPHYPVRWYCNAGVAVVPRAHRHVLAPPVDPLPTYHCAEQDLFNARIQDGQARGEFKVRLLDRRCNWQWWTDHNFKEAPPDAVLHFSGMIDREKRLEAMRRWAEAS